MVIGVGGNLTIGVEGEKWVVQVVVGCGGGGEDWKCEIGGGRLGSSKRYGVVLKTYLKTQ